MIITTKPYVLVSLQCSTDWRSVLVEIDQKSHYATNRTKIGRLGKESKKKLLKTEGKTSDQTNKKTKRKQTLGVVLLLNGWYFALLCFVTICLCFSCNSILIKFQSYFQLFQSFFGTQLMKSIEKTTNLQ